MAVERAVERLAKRALFLAAGTPAQSSVAMVRAVIFEQVEIYLRVQQHGC